MEKKYKDGDFTGGLSKTNTNGAYKIQAHKNTA